MGRREFVAIVAACQAMAASSIDLMLPGFKHIRAEFGLAPDSNRVAWIVTAFFFGIALGQLVYGPLSDRFGRKPLLYTGLVIMMVSSATATMVPSLPALFVCRVFWGLGAGAPRSLAIAMVRDRHEGERMAQMMGFVMATFMVVPILAPSLGTLLLTFASWRILFWTPCVLAGLLSIWLIRLPETLPPERRRTGGPRAMLEALRIVGRTRATLAYGLAGCCLFGTMASMVGNLEVIIDEIYDLDRLFPLIFGCLGITLAIGSLTSARVVTRVGLERLIRIAAVLFLAATTAFLALAIASHGRPAFGLVAACFIVMLIGLSILNANANTAAMVPVPHVAGMAAALLGFTATASGALLASIVNAAFDGTVQPFAIGIFSFALAAAFCVFVVAPAGAPQAPLRSSGAATGPLLPATGD